jgi:hypothetical protein
VREGDQDREHRPGDDVTDRGRSERQPADGSVDQVAVGQDPGQDGERGDRHRRTDEEAEENRGPAGPVADDADREQGAEHERHDHRAERQRDGDSALPA